MFSLTIFWRLSLFAHIQNFCYPNSSLDKNLVSFCSSLCVYLFSNWGLIFENVPYWDPFWLLLPFFKLFTHFYLCFTYFLAYWWNDWTAQVIYRCQIFSLVWTPPKYSFAALKLCLSRDFPFCLWKRNLDFVKCLSGHSLWLFSPS